MGREKKDIEEKTSAQMTTSTFRISKTKEAHEVGGQCIYSR